jgi:hypothetical protein
VKIEDIANILEATIHYVPEESDLDITCAGASDLMSDVLTYISDMPPHIPKSMILITGLLNLQVIRSSALMDIHAVIFSRGKVPTEEIIEKARTNNIAVLSTDLKTYTACGLLFSEGLQSIDGYSYQKGKHGNK